jgi:hypothetical protein
MDMGAVVDALAERKGWATLHLSYVGGVEVRSQDAVWVWMGACV